MKNLLFVLSLLLSLTSHSQYYLNCPEYLVRFDVKRPIEKGYIEEGGHKGEKFLSWYDKEEHVEVVLYFHHNEDSVYMTCFFPDNERILNGWIANYNHKYVRISSKEWHVYTEGKTVRIRLLYLDKEKSYYFALDDISNR
jgi:hypothetical protein